MSNSILCERCCEQIAGTPPEVDWRGSLLHYIEVFFHFAKQVFTVLIRVIGFACFFSVAIWFHPIRALTGAERRTIQAVKDKIRREQEESRRKEEAEQFDRERDEAFRQKRIDALVSANADDAAIANSMKNGIEFTTHQRGAQISYLINSHNGIATKLENGFVDPEVALIDQKRNLQDAKNLLLAECIRHEERGRIQEQINRIDMDIAKQSAQPYDDPFRQQQEMDYLRDRRADAQWKYNQMR